jgi:formylglycine-generating enzyme required for sulfatase activity
MTAAPFPTDPLPPDELRRLSAAVDRFVNALTHTPNTELSQFLPPRDDPYFRQHLVALARAHIDFYCWTGTERLVESVLRLYPELAAHPADVVDLICQEYQSRRRHRVPDAGEYEGRFPDVYETFKARLTGMLHTPPPTPAAFGAWGAGLLLHVGLDLGGYRLRRRIGAGSYGEVWQADAPGGVAVAVKVILRPVDHAEAQRERQALELIKQIQHSFLLSTQAYFLLNNHLVIVVELADRSLADCLAAERAAGNPSGIPAERLMPWMREACEAIDYLHARKIIHRDIKPANILTLGDHIKVADFGLARAYHDGPTLRGTSGGGGLGTPAYMAPELWRKEPATPASDLYALAVTYAELRLGRPPFAADNQIQMMLCHYEGNPNLTGLGPVEEAVVRRALDKDPKKRQTSCLAFWRELQAAEPQSPTPAPPRLVDRDHSPDEIKSLRARWAEHLGVSPGEALTLAGQRIELVLLPPGTFWMGSPAGEPGRRSDEGQRLVVVPEPFYVGRYPITQDQFAAVLGRKSPSWFNRARLGPRAKAGSGRFPVEYITWDAAVEFCDALSKLAGVRYRLPTEVEWEYACRGGACGRASKPFHLEAGPADQLTPADALFLDPGGAPGTTREVGAYRPNRFGLFDFHGNVGEWCADAPASAPGDYRVVRGGSFETPAARCRAAARDSLGRTHQRRDLGFRIVRSAARS